MTTIYYEVDGQPVPDDQCDWVLIAPCGCECGWSLARYTKDEDSAWDGFSRSKAVRRRDEKLGYRVIVKRHSDICMDDCQHTPTYGVEPRPQLDGHTWAAKREGRTLHLVPLVIEKNSYAPFQQEAVLSICGRTDGFSWSTKWFEINGRTDCVACIAEAKRVLAEVSA